MTESPSKSGLQDVPTQVFERFLQALEVAGSSVELVSNLRKTLIHNKTFTEQALKNAVLGEELPK